MATASRGYKKYVKRFYYSIRNSLFFYSSVLNLPRKLIAKRALRRNKLSEIELKILNELKRDGIAVTTLSEISNEFSLDQLSQWISENERFLVQKPKKKFLYSYYGTNDKSKPLDLDNPFVKFYLSDTVLKIAFSYLGYAPQLHEVYIEKTIPVGDAQPEFSQNWHRDPEEKRTLKVFIYLNDVDINSGPFTYVKSSQPSAGSTYSKLFPQKLPWGSYPASQDVEKETDLRNHFTAIGKKGTVIFCDTAGLHRGGYAKSKERIMATGFYPSKHYIEEHLYSVKTDLRHAPVSQLGKIVLTAAHKN